MASPKAKKFVSKPDIHDFTDYRLYLAAEYGHRRSKNERYSETSFIQLGGMGASSRGYLGLILKGKRNLGHKTIIAFAEGLKLSEKEAQYFENLVHYNQATDEKKKSFYFDRLEKLIKGRGTPAFELLRCQFHFFTRWYVAAVRELMNLPDFREDPAWISQRLRSRITPDEVKEAIADLLSLKLITRNRAGKLLQTSRSVQATDPTLNQVATLTYHKNLLKLSEIALGDPYTQRSFNSLMLCCEEKEFANMRKDIGEFLGQMMAKYASDKKAKAGSMVNVSVNVIHLTTPSEDNPA